MCLYLPIKICMYVYLSLYPCPPLKLLLINHFGIFVETYPDLKKSLYAQRIITKLVTKQQALKLIHKMPNQFFLTF